MNVASRSLNAIDVTVEVICRRTVRLIRRLLSSLIKIVVTILENSTIEVKEGVKGAI